MVEQYNANFLLASVYLSECYDGIHSFNLHSYTYNYKASVLPRIQAVRMPSPFVGGVLADPNRVTWYVTPNHSMVVKASSNN